MKINLGCGSDYRPGWLNVDQFENCTPDLVMNIDQPPWPIESDFAEHVLLKRVLEHVGQDATTFLEIVKELYRICKPGATIEIHAPHPRHADFLSDPTHVRPILPEMFNGFDLATVEQWQGNGLPGTPLAIHLKVDFETAETEYFLDPQWQAKLARGEIDTNAVSFAARSHANVIQWTRIVLRARKPFTPGRSLAGLTALRIIRSGGLGDVLMALCAADTIARLAGTKIIFQTAPEFRALAEACPFIAEVVTAPAEVASIESRFATGGAAFRSVNLDPARHGLCRLHEVESFLRSGFGIHAPGALKGFRIEPPAAAQRRVAERLESIGAPAPGRRRVLLHPAGRDTNRTWPRERWQELADRLRAEGHQVLAIGQRARDGSGVFMLDGVVSLIDAFDAMETIALMNGSQLLVATDSGPVQLAGLTDIGIVGIYSVVAGRNRLPYRNGSTEWRSIAVSPECAQHPCYERMLGSDEFAAHASTPRTAQENAKFLGDWCLNPKRYACLLQEITVERVMAACHTLLADA